MEPRNLMGQRDLILRTTPLSVSIVVEHRKKHHDILSIRRYVIAIPTQVLLGFFQASFDLRKPLTSDSFEAQLVKLKLPFVSSFCNSLDKAFASSILSTATSKSFI